MSKLSFDVPDPQGLPDVVRTASDSLAQKQLPTTDNLAYVLNALKIELKYNVMTHTPVLVHPLFDDSELSQTKARLTVRDMLHRMRIAPPANLDEMISSFAREDPFHPMMQWIDTVPWDGVDRFKQLVDSVDTESPMWPIYLRRWLVQIAEAVFGWQEGVPRSLPNTLVFAGKQGVGKGRWFRSLVPEEFIITDAELHLGSSMGKDHQMQVLRYPIVELGEIDATFRKADVSALKAFLSRTTDEIREPYARRAIAHMRSSVFAGTVNDFEFLNDATGSRRYWPVYVEGDIRWDHGIDLQQLWAQVAAAWEAGEEWFLTKGEEEGRIADSVQFQLTSRESDLIETLFYDHGGEWDNYYVGNKTDIAMLIGLASPNRQTLASIAQYQHERYGKHRKLNGKQRAWCVPGGLRAHTVPGLVKVTETQAKQYLKWNHK